jgi:hypothetical protein
MAMQCLVNIGLPLWVATGNSQSQTTLPESQNPSGHSIIVGSFDAVGRLGGDVGYVYKINAHDGFESSVQVCSKPIDKQGQFRCPGLQAGEYLVSIRTTSSDGTRTIYYPGNTSLSFARLVEVAKNDNQAVNVAAPELVDGNIVGKLIPRANGPSSIKLYSVRSDAPGVEIPIDHDGTVSPNGGEWSLRHLPIGNYELRADWVNGSESLHSVEEFSLSSSGQTSLDIVDQTAQSLTINVSAETVGLLPRSIDLVSTKNRLQGAHLAIDQEGKSFSSNLSEGEYRVMSSEGGWYVESLAANGKQMLGDTFSVLAGADTHLQITFALGNRVLQGIAVDDNDSAVPAEVLVRGESNSVQRVGSTDKNGRFSFEGLPEDQYLVSTWRPQDSVPFQNPSVLARLASSSVELRLELPAMHPLIRVPIVQWKTAW